MHLIKQSFQNQLLQYTLENSLARLADFAVGWWQKQLHPT